MRMKRLLTLALVTTLAIFGTIQTRFSSHAQMPPPPLVIYAVTTNNTLISFNAITPNTLLNTTAITGLPQGENVLGIDFRPRTNQLFALSSASRLYTINIMTGAATAVGTAAFTPALSGTSFGFDFNPVPDRIRVTSDLDQNLRLNPDTGGVGATDTVLSYMTGDANAAANPNVVGAAYTNSFAGPTSTTLYGIDSNLDILVRQGSVGGAPDSPNNGKLNTVGRLGVDTTDQIGFDIVAPNDVAYASLTTAGASGSSLYSINLNTGAATLVGAIGGGQIIRDIAIPVTFIPSSQQAGFAVVNAASYSIDSVAANSIATIFGSFATTNNQPASAMGQPLPTTLGGVQVTVNNMAAGLWFVSTSQINFLVPPGTMEGQATFVITDASGATKTGQVSITRAAPGIFTANASGTGSATGFSTPDGVALTPLTNANGSERTVDPGTPNNPMWLVLYGTGIRNAPAANPNDADGVAEAVMVTVQGIPARVTYAGPVAGLSGLDQINVVIPPQLAGAGQVRVRVTVNGQVSNTVTVTLGGTAPPVMAQPIALGQFLAGSLTSSDQVLRDETGRTYFFDAYRFTATSSTTLAVDVRSAAFDAAVALYKRNADGSVRPVAVDDNLGGLGDGGQVNNNALLLTVLEEGGDYVLYVTSAQTAENALGGYTVRLLNNPLTQSSIGAMVNGTIGADDVQTAAGDYLDGYWFTGVAGERIVIKASTTFFDPLLILNRNNGETIAVDDNSGGGPLGRDAQITITLPSTGIYVAVVTPLAPGITGPYTFSITRASNSGTSLETEALSLWPSRALLRQGLLEEAPDESRFDQFAARRVVR